MIHDRETNILYLSALLPTKYTTFFDRFADVLGKWRVQCELLKGTKDIWCVDYMPVQVTETAFVQFTYNPSYLNSKKYQKTITDPSAICEGLGIAPTRSTIKIDGGNVVKGTRRVIVTDRIFSENPAYTETGLLDQLSELHQLDRILVIPSDPRDFTGHADGMVRFLDEDTVLVNQYSRDDNDFAVHLRSALRNAGVELVEIPYRPNENGLYINYLQMENIIFLPVFGMESDELAVKAFEGIFRGTDVVPVLSSEIAAQGGVLNCISWNIKVP